MTSYFLYTVEKNDVTNPMETHLDMGLRTIKNLAQNDADKTTATNKKYVDDMDETNLDLAGTRQMLGDLDLNDHSILNVEDTNNNSSVVSKKYVGDNDAKFLPLDGSRAMSANLNMGIRKINFLSSPTGPLDATNKNYVDTIVANSPQIHQYGFSFTELSLNTREYPFYFYKGSPAPYMFLKNLKTPSYFHLQSHHFDTDTTIPTNLTIQYRLTIFKLNGNSLHSIILNAIFGLVNIVV